MRKSVRQASGLVGAVAVVCAGLAGLAASPRSLQATPASAQSAKDLYLDKCAVCHGADGHAKTAKGKKSKTKDINETIKTMSEADMIKMVHDGKAPNMDAWGKQFNADQIQGLVQYYRGLAAK
jgi:cytochrome c6